MKALAALVLAISICAPSLPRSQVESYARALHQAAAKHRVPAMLGVAIVENESHWHRSLVVRRGSEEYVGLGMIRSRNYAACRAGLDTPDCAAVRARLLVGEENLRVVASTLAANARYCRAHGHPGVAAALAGYQGNGCTPSRLTRKVLARWAALRRLTRGGALRRAAPRAAMPPPAGAPRRPTPAPPGR